MSKPYSHRGVLTKLIFLYLNFLFWQQQLGFQLKFQARADVAEQPLLPEDEVSTLRSVILQLGLKPRPSLPRTYCTNTISIYGISIRCNCYYKQNPVCHITSISLNSVGLTTGIPEEVGALSYLSYLGLSNNKLEGPIPASLGNLDSLETLDLSGNQLTGPIPDELGNLRSLRWLYLQKNLLEGTIPPTFGSLVKLEELYLHFNKLSGSIPDDLGNLVNLAYLDISENQLRGPLPEIGKLKNLRYFWATANSLIGTFPESYGELTSLRTFTISGNSISGPLPVDIIKKWTNIEYLSLIGNHFKGKLTKEIFNLPNLQHLHVSDLENATYELPLEITNTKYVSLILRNCSINGSIPKYIGEQMTSLNHLDLSLNSLTGGLPEYMKSDMLYMSFSTNMLNGTIPAWIFQTVKTRIDLSFNNLSTALESEIPRINSSLNLFACCNNSAATEMRDPLEIMNTYCQGHKHKYHSLFINCGGGETTVNGDTYEQDINTASFFTSPNKNWAYSFSGGFFEGNISSNDYTKNMSCGVSVAEAPLYDKARLAPVSIKYYGFCLREGDYNVTLKFAEILYTDDADYTSLRKRAFDIYIQDDKINDFNIKERAGVPDTPITKTVTAVVNKNNPLLKIHLYWDGKGSFAYGPALNGPLISAIAVIPRFKVQDEKLQPLHITLIGIGSTFVVLVLLAFAWICWLRSRNSPDIKVGEEKEKHVTLKELVNATGKFTDKEKIIGTSSLGEVYKAELHGQIKTTVAVKKLSANFKENIKKFMRETKLLHELRHENLIKMFGYHIEKDLQLLVYEYMQFGSLEDALKSGDSDTISLKFTWNTRVKMCLGIARGLEYLHGHQRLNLIHRNIKADNILLDGDLNPKITDFGLAHLYIEEGQFKVIKEEVSQGYIAPEYFQVQGKLSNKADVYSFGVILLEIVSWKKNVNIQNHGTEILVDTAHKKHEQGSLEDLINSTLQSDTQQALTILKLAVKCTSIAPSVRPTMPQVVKVLLGEIKIDELFRSAPPNAGEKIKGTGDLASTDLAATPSSSSPSPKTKDELET